MDIINRVGEEITNAGMELAKITKEMTENAKLHATITSEEAKIREQFRTIGQMYYEQCKNTEQMEVLSEEYKEAFDKISISKWKIGEAKETLAANKGNVLCPECGIRISKYAMYCSKCGEKL